MLDGTPTVVVTTRGGADGPGTPREGWDHNIDHLRQILVQSWGADLTVVEREFTLVVVTLHSTSSSSARRRCAAAEATAVEADRDGRIRRT